MTAPGDPTATRAPPWGWNDNAPEAGSSVLVTGAGSGLGHAMCEAFDAIPFVRGSIAGNRAEPYDAIIHCAVNTAREVPVHDAYGYLDDNLLLTQRLLEVPHKRFVYLSSVDIYRPMESLGLYAAAKLFSESLVRAHATRPLILRPVTLLGPRMRPNTVLRLLTEPNAKLFLAAASRFNFVLHSDVCAFVRTCMERDTEGTFNLASADSIGLGEIAQRLGKLPRFGEHLYDVGEIDHRAAAQIDPSFGRTSWQTLELFIWNLKRTIN